MTLRSVAVTLHASRCICLMYCAVGILFSDIGLESSGLPTGQNQTTLKRQQCSSKEQQMCLGNTEYFELCEVSSETQMPGLLSLLANRHHLLHMAQVHTAVGEEPTDNRGQIRRLVNSRVRHQEKPDPWCSPWSVCEAVHVFQGA